MLEPLPKLVMLTGYAPPSLSISSDSGSLDPFSSKESERVPSVSSSSRREVRVQSAMENEGSCVWTLQRDDINKD